MIQLPNEIWIYIFSLALHLGNYLDGLFEPRQIDESVRLIAMDMEAGLEERKIFARSRTRFMLVCRLWRYIADMLLIDSWSLETKVKVDTSRCLIESRGRKMKHTEDFISYIDNTEEMKMITMPSVDTQGFRKIKIYYETETSTGVRLAYKYPIQSISVKIESHGKWPGTNFLSPYHIISHPAHLQVLHLEMDSTTRPQVLLSYLEMFTPNLTVLSLDTLAYHLLPQTLSIPSLTSLFLTIPPDSYYQQPISFNHYTEEYDWTFPSLRNLAIQGRGCSDDLNIVILHPLPALFESIIKKHSDKIVSFRINPIYIDIMNDQLPYCWFNLPRLAAFASNFAEELFAVLPLKRSEANCSASLRHLIQVPGRGFELEKVVRGLSKCIEACSQLETVTIPYNLSKGQKHKYISSIVHLRTVCHQRGLKLLNLDGDEIPLSFEEEQNPQTYTDTRFFQRGPSGKFKARRSTWRTHRRFSLKNGFSQSLVL
jgi:hypothetical protein